MIAPSVIPAKFLGNGGGSGANFKVRQLVTSKGVIFQEKMELYEAFQAFQG